MRRPRRLIGAACVLLAVAGCARPRPTPASDPPPAIPSDPAPAAGVLALPEVPGFTAGSPEPGDGFVRRTYSRGGARVQVTLARMPMTPGAYDQWVAASIAFPQADLAVPAADANGFYQCAEGAHPSCDLLIQLRAGLHLELRGGGTSSRADVDALAHGLPLRTWGR